MKSVKVVNGDFEASFQKLDDGRVVINFIIPEATDTFNPDDYSYLIDHVLELIRDTSGRYSVQFQGLDAPLSH